LKLKSIRISAELLAEWLRGDFRRFTIEPPLPTDLRIIDIVRTVTPNLTNTFDLIVESEEFEDIKESSVIPDLLLICHEVPTVELFTTDKDGKKIKIVVEGVTDY